MVIAVLQVYSCSTGHRVSDSEMAALGSGRTINEAQVTYAAHSKAGFACDLGLLGREGFIDRALAEGRKDGFVFAIVDCKRQNDIVLGYTWVASPTEPGAMFFCGDETGVIRFSSRDATDCLRNGQPLR